MRVTSDYYAAAFLGLASLLPLGCGDSTGPAAAPTTGAIAISVWTTSAPLDVDPDGYTLSIDDGPGQAVGVNATLTIGALPEGSHLLRLDGLAPNCSVSGPNPLSIDVIADNPVSLASFSVSCSAKDGSGEGAWDY